MAPLTQDELNRRRNQLIKDREAGRTPSTYAGEVQPSQAALNATRRFQTRERAGTTASSNEYRNLKGAPTSTVAKIFGASQQPAGLTQEDIDALMRDAFNRTLNQMGTGVASGGISQKQKNLNRYAQMLKDILAGNKFAQDFDSLGKDYGDIYDTGIKNLESLLGTRETAADDLSRMLAEQYDMNQRGLLGRLGQTASTAQGDVNTAMNRLQSFLTANQVNPYANFQVAGAPTGEAAITPGMRDLLATQGVSAQPLEQFAQATGQQNQAQADAFANIARIMAGTTEQANLGRLADVEAQRASALTGLSTNQALADYNIRQQTQNLLNELASQDYQRRQQMGEFGLEQRLGLQNQLAERKANLSGSKAKTRQEYISLLLDAIAKGGNPGKLTGVFK